MTSSWRKVCNASSPAVSWPWSRVISRLTSRTPLPASSWRAGPISWGAIRLPSDAFKREGTAVVTDIVFLKKRAPGQEPNHADADWLHVAPLSVEGAAVPVNRYFLKHPEMVLGDWSRKDTLYGGEGFSVLSNGDLASQLKEATSQLPVGQVSHAELANPPPAIVHPMNGSPVNGKKIPVTAPIFIPPPPLRHITEGSLFVGDDKIIRQVEDGKAEPVTYCGVLLKSDGTPQARKIAALIGCATSPAGSSSRRTRAGPS